MVSENYDIKFSDFAGDIESLDFKVGLSEGVVPMGLWPGAVGPLNPCRLLSPPREVLSWVRDWVMM